MKISSLKHLNSNWYNTIMIRNLNSCETKVDVKCYDKIQTTKSNYTFYNHIKNLNDKDKIKEIIRYYLRNNKIYSLEDDAIIKHYDGNFIAIEGTRNLYLQLSEGSLDKEILDEIKEKYIRDRYEFLFNNTFKNIEIRLYNNISSYYVYEENNEKILSIHLLAKGKELLSFEKDFLDQFTNYLFNNTDSKIYYYSEGLSSYYVKNYHNLKFGEHPGIYFKGTNLVISINRNLFNDFYDLMYCHNNKIEEAKKLQLTFGDIK